MSYRVAINSEKVTFEVLESESILDGALRNGIGLQHGCRNGQCGTCKAKVNNGNWRYLDGYTPDILTRSEVDQGMAVSCKATPQENLNIELNYPLDEHFDSRELATTIERIDQLAPDVVRLVLCLPEGETLAYHPGQYINFLLEDGQRRAFSLAAQPDADCKLEFHIRRVDGGLFTERLFSSLKPGDEICIEGPLGSFRFEGRSNRPVIFIAGGTGFAPIKSILEGILDKEEDRSIWLYWGVRDSESLYFDDLPRRWAERHEQFHYVPVVSEPDTGWLGRCGLLHAAVVKDHPDLSEFDIYMAGPPAMIDVAREVFLAYGHADERLFCDTFHSGFSPGKKRKSFFRSRLQGLFT